MNDKLGVKIFVCSHKSVELPEHSLLLPLQVGAALSDTRLAGYLYDDTGKNISKKNRSYCELTGQYWAWKNIDAEYYGFFHYRRFLYPDQMAKRPYIIERFATKKLLKKLKYDEFLELIHEYDLIVPKGIKMYVSIREHYASADFHHIKDFTLMEKILREFHPEDEWAIEQYFSSDVHYFGNIFIMRHDVFMDYAEWLFPCLEEFDRRVNNTEYGKQEMRVDGYLAERLLGVYYTKNRTKIRTTELPEVHIYGGKEFITKKVTDFFFPPGTKRRAKLKRLLRENGWMRKK